MVANFLYMPKVYIYHYLHGDIVIKKTKDLSQNSQNRWYGEKQITYMNHIKIQSWHMGVIFMPNIKTWKMQQCVLTHSQIMLYHTGNVYFDVVTNVKALIFLIRKQRIRIPTPFLQLVFTLSSNCVLYKTWQASVNWLERFLQVSTWYYFRTINKNIH